MQIWRKYDNDFSGKLDKSEFIEFIKELHLHIEITPEEIFLKVDSDRSGKIDFEEFAKFFDDLTSAKEFEKIFLEYCGNKDFLNTNDLMKFMKEVQGEEVTFPDALDILIDNNSEINSQTAKELREKIAK